MTTVRDAHNSLEQSKLYQVETLVLKEDQSLVWEPFQSHMRTAGRSLTAHPTYRPFINCTARVMYQHGVFYGGTFTYTDETMAVQLAKALAHIWDKPLRVMQVQRIRIQKQIGKIILPVGGI